MRTGHKLTGSGLCGVVEFPNGMLHFVRKDKNRECWIVCLDNGYEYATIGPFEAGDFQTIDWAGVPYGVLMNHYRFTIDGRLKKAAWFAKHGDCKAESIGAGRFRMLPSGDLVTRKERDQRLKHKNRGHSRVPRT